ncbi:carbohydrate kinase family protein [Patescibacteria group bacterium]|nr:carbohydrate kinase family protein [Patescibacteria group bacterium]
MAYDVITIGTVTRDVFLKSGDFEVVKNSNYRTGRAGCFVLGTKLEIPKVAIASGGGGTNAAVSFSRQGFKTGCIGRIGNDEIGKEIIEELKQEGVDSLFQIDKEYDTAYSTILVAADGERTILEYRGANDYINEKEIKWNKLKSKWVFIDSLAGNVNLLTKILDWAKQNGIKTAFNPGKRLIKLGIGLHKYLEDIDIFIANEDESAYVAGIEYEEDKEPEIFKKLDEVVKGIVVMTKGPRGVEVSDGKKHYLAGIPDSPILDRTGAGDSFGSGFVAGYIESNSDIEFAIQLGTSNATSVVQYFGAKQGLLKKGEWGKYPKVEVQIKEI